MNNKGFTLVELLATILILVLVISISTFSISEIIKKANEENYKLLLRHIKDASELYYQECKYANNSGITCSDDNMVSLGDLVKYGYLKGNSKNDDDEYILINSRDNNDISHCVIEVTYIDDEVNVRAVTTENSCPTEY